MTLATGTSAIARPVEQRRQLHARSPDELWCVAGAAVAAIALVWVLHERLLPFKGVLGFVVSCYVVFLVLYALLVSATHPRIGVVDRLAAVVCFSAAALVLGALASVLGFTLVRGWQALSHVQFFTTDLSVTAPGDPLVRGGVLHGVVGTLQQIGIAVAITVPLGLACAVFMNEVRGRLARPVRTLVDAMSAVPSIVAGLFVFSLLILGLGIDQSGVAASVAISVMMLPIVIRTAEVVLRLVPNGLREASLALGASQWQTVLHVVLPTAKSGLTTAVVLAMARGIGETAPVLLTAGFNQEPQSRPAVRPSGVLAAGCLQPGPTAGAGSDHPRVRRRLHVACPGPRAFHCGPDTRRAPISRDESMKISRCRSLPRQIRRVRAVTLSVLAFACVAGALAFPAEQANAATNEPINGSGSTWSANAIERWISNVKAFGITVNYAALGSSAGRSAFKQGIDDFSVSEVPYGVSPNDDPPPRSFAYMPIVAGGTALQYQLRVGNTRITDLRLSGETVTKIFTGQITNWNDPQITKDYGRALPSKRIVPLVRSDGSGTSAQFSRYMSQQYPAIWGPFCSRYLGGAFCDFTSNYPQFPGSKALAGSDGVSNFVHASYGDGSIGYVEYSYALEKGDPVVSC